MGALARDVPRSGMRRRIRLGRWIIAAVGAVAFLAAAFYGGGAWYFSGQIADATFDAGAHRVKSATHAYTIPIVSLESTATRRMAITMRVPAGTYGFTTEGVWGVQASDGGFGQIGAIITTGEGTVTREFKQLTGPQMRAGEKLELVSDAYPEDPMQALGIPYRNVTYPGPLGDYPAWFIDGTTPDWAILVHGDALHRQDQMEMLAPLHRAGMPMLVISYRNDPGAPAAPDGLVRYGATEWLDLEAAVIYALGHGARHVILVGRSMGGGVVASFLERSSLAGQVNAVILDSPMLDFSEVIDFGASQRTLPVVGLPIPTSLVALAKWVASLRYNVDLGSMDYLAHDGKLRAPILLFHGSADVTVPQSVSDRLAKDRPDLVTYVVTPGAGHLDSWNIDPTRYEQYVQGFAAAHALD